MSQRVSERGVFTPDELAMLSRAFSRACGECSLHGAEDRQRLAKSLMTIYRRGRTEAEMVLLARTMIFQWRGLLKQDTAA
ncbi:MAG: hypothetical protein JWN93_2628 [Hyphomicrobiales bacterium]|nr:hypothetical protein [Hyphomicrobiales bacterium]